jgi:hypothetical protein
MFYVCMFNVDCGGIFITTAQLEKSCDDISINSHNLSCGNMYLSAKCTYLIILIEVYMLNNIKLKQLLVIFTYFCH